MSMGTLDTLLYRRTPLIHGSGAIRAVEFGARTSDSLVTKQPTEIVPEAGEVMMIAMLIVSPLVLFLRKPRPIN
jgi:hypothetical protein